jgi:N-acetylated-alpha-linked acidic dipeptidase
MHFRQLSALAAFAAGASACQRDLILSKRHTHRQPLTRRSDTNWPPVLTDQETILVNAFDNSSIDQWSDYYGHQNKLAGEGKEAAQWTADQWSENGFESHLAEYHVFLRYPVSSSLHVTGPNGTTSEINIREEVLPEDDVTSRNEISQQTFLAYAPGGNASAEYVYAGYVQQHIT